MSTRGVSYLPLIFHETLLLLLEPCPEDRSICLPGGVIHQVIRSLLPGVTPLHKPPGPFFFVAALGTPLLWDGEAR